ncbi:unnamed protein product [Eruca vesicaria subsp. sativa]|uniref:KIB1-4 beta-propeller domain-containing protein n=1 Tax=Eruca vesicaria subsp. sativa TaxID=29727 RepID=A0ABC8M8C5_ERUVS|nr:unnamed protein product [Eruca vesicaria subsp. sativa]
MSPLNLCSRKPWLVRSSPHLSDGLSSSSTLRQMAPVIVCNDPCRPYCKKVLFMTKSLSVTRSERKECAKLMWEMGKIASSNGWIAILKDGAMHLRDTDLITEPKRIPLPPLTTLPHCQTQVVTNVAMSSTFPEEEDCVVAVKFLGPQLSFCRPNNSKEEWINVRIENPSFFSSPIIFSKKHGVFLTPGAGGHVIASWDHHNPLPKLQTLRFQNLPKLSKTKRDILDSCSTSEHLVESKPTGEMFMVKLYRKFASFMFGTAANLRTEALMVFKLDDEGNAVYTQDIGDLCIYLTRSEPFCLPSSFSPTLCRPNRVKIFDIDEDKFFKLSDQKWNCSRQTPLESFDCSSGTWSWV